MPQLKFSMEEIRKVMEEHAKSKFGLSNQAESHFKAEINEDDQTENVEFIIDYGKTE
jgi:hypothetical protein